MKERQCNVCGKVKRPHKFKHDNKKTCMKCEYRWYYRFLRAMVQDRQLTPIERISYRLGYMGTAFIMISPYLLKYDSLGAYTYVIGGLISIPQVWVSKHWNLVAVNLNVMIGYLIYLLSQ